ncbi:MAG TPA: TRAP transporter permease [Clostridia bacterium]|nr:TRAP transporter permease [Clostridia bacterium]
MSLFFKQPLPLKVAEVIGISMSLFQLYTGVFGSFPALVQRSLHLLFILLLVFLIYPINKGREGKPLGLVDCLCVVGALFSMGYILINYNYITQVRFYGFSPVLPVEIVGGLIGIIILLEATRRVLGWGFTGVALAFVAYAFMGPYLPGILFHSGVSLSKFIEVSYLHVGGIFGTPLGISATYIVLFVLFGAFVNETGFGEFFTTVATGLTGRTRGGPAKVAVVSSALFGTISGAASANVATTGTFTIPMMKKLGFKPHFAGAVEAVASTGGEIMPPIMGAAAFLMAEFSGIPYIVICKHAVLPAILYFVAVYFMVDFEAGKTGLKGLMREEIPDWKPQVKTYAHMLLPIILLLYLLIVGYTPTFAATLAIIGGAMVSMLRAATRLNLEKILLILWNGARGTIIVALATAVAGLIIGIVGVTGLGSRFTSIVLDLSQGSFLLALVMTMLAAIVLGMGMPVSAAYILQVALVIPALIKLGLLPIQAHMFAFYFAVISMITPPVAIAAYVAAGIAGSSPFITGLTATRLGATAFIVPYVFAFAPALLMVGSPIEIIGAAITALIGVYALAIGLEGFWHGNLGVLQRILAVGAALAMIYPGLATDIIGLLGLVLLFFWEKKIDYMHRVREVKETGS